MKLAAFIGIVALMIISTIYNGWVLSILWKWFVVSTFGLPALGIAQGIGLSLTVGFLTKNHKPTEAESKKSFAENFTEGITTALIYPSLALLFGWIYQMFL